MGTRPLILILVWCMVVVAVTAGHVDYTPGTLPIILTVPHGGTDKPDSIPKRNEVSCGETPILVADTKTIEIAEKLVDKLFAETGKKPHLIINNLHRSKMDANRDITSGACGNAEAEEAYLEYENYVKIARNAIESAFRRDIGGLLLDIHGVASHAMEWVELGYDITSDSLDSGDYSPADSSIKALGERKCPDLLEEACFRTLIRGAFSLGDCICAVTGECNAVPSPEHHGPDGNDYFNGGYTVENYGSKDSGTIDAIQVEIPARLRTERDYPPFSDKLALAIQGYFEHWYYKL